MNIEIIRDWLRNFAEDYKKEMSANVYENIWNMIQSIDEELKKKD